MEESIPLWEHGAMLLRSVALVVLLWRMSLLPDAREIELDFQRTNGVVRPLHGVNLGPLCYRGTVDLSEYHRELGIPLVRLHDVVWVNAEAVDIHTVFPDFRDDPSQAGNYRFEPTDDYLQAIVNTGSGILYRLGESIEHTPRKYFVHPPADDQKWAAICLGIIRHYNRGWANGYHHNIRYWEIWNEPDVRPAMWTGNERQYFQLYEAAAKAIKAEFPEVKVGGPALGHIGSFADGVFQPSAFFTNFLNHCKTRRAPLDFFSWHRYTSKPWDIPKLALAARRVLDEYGFAQTESHLNEWNYLPNDDWHPMLREGQGKERKQWYRTMGGAGGAAFAACVLTLLQDVPITTANYYTGEVQGFGLFDIDGTPKQTFFAFKAFRELLDTPVRFTIPNENGFACLAGLSTNRTRATVLLSNFDSADRVVTLTLSHVPWNGTVRYELLSVTEDGLSVVRKGSLASASKVVKVDLPMPGVLLLRLFPE